MSGHSKWSTIKRQKGINDAKKGQLFSKLARAITLAAKQGGVDPVTNFHLRLVIDKAREANMPKENVDRALRQAQGKLENELEELVYEGYGPNGVAFIVEAATDNRNRTTQEIKNIFERGGGSLSTPGSVAFQFEQKGLILVDKGASAEEKMLQLIDLGVEDVEEVEDGIEVYTKPNELFQVREKLVEAGVTVKSAELMFKPTNVVVVHEKDKAQRLMNLMEALDDHDDVQKVYANFELIE